MQPGSAQARIRESLDKHPELTVILDANGNPSSRLRTRFRQHGEDSLQIQLDTALGQNMLISIAGEVETGSGRAPLLGQYRVRSCKIVGGGKYHADLIPEVASGERPEQTSPERDEHLDYYAGKPPGRNEVIVSDDLVRIIGMKCHFLRHYIGFGFHSRPGEPS
jgi:hypothetical protein